MPREGDIPHRYANQLWTDYGVDQDADSLCF